MNNANSDFQAGVSLNANVGADFRGGYQTNLEVDMKNNEVISEKSYNQPPIEPVLENNSNQNFNVNISNNLQPNINVNYQNQGNVQFNTPAPIYPNTNNYQNYPPQQFIQQPNMQQQYYQPQQQFIGAGIYGNNLNGVYMQQPQVMLQHQGYLNNLGWSNWPTACGVFVPKISTGAAIFILVLNIFFPGIGTMFAGCFPAENSKDKVTTGCCFFWLGWAHLALSLSLIGWILAIVFGIQLLQCSNLIWDDSFYNISYGAVTAVPIVNVHTPVITVARPAVGFY